MVSAQEKLEVLKKLNGNENSLGVLDVKKMLQLRGLNKLSDEEKEIIKEIRKDIDTSKGSLLDLKNEMLNDSGFQKSVYKYIENLKIKGKFKGPIIDTNSRLDKLMLGFYMKMELGKDIDFDELRFDTNLKVLKQGNGKAIEIKKQGHFYEISPDKQVPEDTIPNKIDTNINKSQKTEKSDNMDVYANNPNVEDGGNQSRIKTQQEKILEGLGVKETTPDHMTPVPYSNDEEKLTLSSTTIMTFEDGNISLTGKDGKKIQFHEKLIPSQKEVLKKYEKLSILKEVIEIWSGKAKEVASSIFWKESRNDDDIIGEQISKIENTFSEAFSNPGGGNIDTSIKQIFDSIDVAEDQEAIIGSSDMENVKSILLGTGDKDTKLKQIFNAMRHEGLSGDSIKIKEKVADHLLVDKNFNSVNEILNNPDLIGLIENNNKDKLGALIGTELATEILKSYTKISTKQEKHRDDYTEALKELNTKRVENGEDEISLPDFIKTSTQYSVLHLLKHALLRKKIAEEQNRGDESSYTGIYADISGLAENKSWADYFDVQDKNIGTIIDVGSTLALSILSMGVGAIAARAAVGAVSYTTRSMRTASTLNRLQSSGKIGKRSYEAGKFVGTAGIEGLAFYEGTTIAQNLIYGNEGFLANTGNGKEILKSIAFMGALRGVQKIWGIKSISNLGAKVPNNILKSSGKVAIEAAAITGVSVQLETYFEGEGEWTWGEYLQAIAMVGLFKGAGKVNFNKTKITFSKTKNGLKATFEKGRELGKKAIEKSKPKIDTVKDMATKKIKKVKKGIDKAKSGIKTTREKMKKKEQSNFILKETSSGKIQDIKVKIGVINKKIKHFENLKKKSNIQESQKLEKKIEDLRNQQKSLSTKIDKVLKPENNKNNEKSTNKVEKGNKKKENPTLPKHREILRSLNSKIEEFGKPIYKNIKTRLSNSGLAKLGSESKFIKEFKENTLKQIKKDYEGGKYVAGTLKGAKFVGKTGKELGIAGMKKVPGAVKETSISTKNVISAMNLRQYHKNLGWKEKIIGGVTAATAGEFISKYNEDESIFEKKHLVNIGINSVNLATLGFWTLFSEPVIDTLYGKFKNFEPRDFLPAYFDNLTNPGRTGTPYAIGESIGKGEVQILKETIKNAKRAGFSERMIQELRDTLATYEQTEQ